MAVHRNAAAAGVRIWIERCRTEWFLHSPFTHHLTLRHRWSRLRPKDLSQPNNEGKREYFSTDVHFRSRISHCVVARRGIDQPSLLPGEVGEYPGGDLCHHDLRIPYSGVFSFATFAGVAAAVSQSECVVSPRLPCPPPRKPMIPRPSTSPSSNPT